MTQTHTPGPWLTADAARHNGPTNAVETVDGELVAMCPAHNPNSDANARLVAAAPDMLEPLRKYAGQLMAKATMGVPISHDWLANKSRAMYATIAKAKGDE